MKRLRTRIFDQMAERGFETAKDLATAIVVSEAQVSMIRSDQRRIHQDFITGVLGACPGATFDDLFYFEDIPEPHVTAVGA